MSDVYTVRESNGVWMVYAGEVAFMTFGNQAIALEFASKAQILIDKARKNDRKCLA